MQILNIFHVLVAIALVGFVLIQKGQGATAGAAFGSGASGTVFGARGAGNFLSRTTWVLAALFCALSLTIAVLVSRNVGVPETDLGVVDSAPVEQVEELGGEGQAPAIGPESTDLPADLDDVLPDGAIQSDVPADMPQAMDEGAMDEGTTDAGAADLPASEEMESVSPDTTDVPAPPEPDGN